MLVADTILVFTTRESGRIVNTVSVRRFDAVVNLLFQYGNTPAANTALYCVMVQYCKHGSTKQGTS